MFHNTTNYTNPTPPLLTPTFPNWTQLTSSYPFYNAGTLAFNNTSREVHIVDGPAGTPSSFVKTINYNEYDLDMYNNINEVIFHYKKM